MRTFVLLIFILSPDALGEVMPMWIQTMRLPSDKTSIYSVGFAESESLNKAMTDAWNAAVLNAVRTNVPELIDISELSNESLSGADFDRRSATELDRIKIKGMSEADDKGSPFVSKKGNLYRIWRVARWTRTGIEASKSTIIERESQPRVIKANFNQREKVRVMNAATQTAESTPTDSRPDFIATFLMKIECGTTLDQIKKALGEPDVVNEYWNAVQYGFRTVYLLDHQGEKIPWAIHSTVTGNRVRIVCQ